jgi:hypothetical protein
MKKLWLALGLISSLGLAPAQAQNAGWPPPAGAVAFLGVYNSALPTLTNGQVGFVQVDANGKLLTNSSVTVTGFAPSTAFATCTSTSASCASTALPTNTGSVILFNSGSTTVSCTLASGAATALTSELQIPASSGLPLATVYGATTYDHFACIDQTGNASNVVVASGGSGLPTGWGGGGGGGSGGAVTLASGAVSSGAYSSGSIASGAYASGSIASGAMVDLGAQADAACGTATGTCSAIALLKFLNTTAGSAIPAGTNLIGKVGIDQTTPGTTNGVALTQINAATTLAGNGPTGTGAQRVTLSQDGSSAAINVSTATTTQLVALSGSTVIYVTSFDVIAGGTGNITFEYGTGASCGTGTTALTGAYPLIANSGISKGSGTGTILKVPAGNALCVLTSAAVQMSGSISYLQY